MAGLAANFPTEQPGLSRHLDNSDTSEENDDVKAQDASDQALGKTFWQFSQLPAELRVRIYEDAAFEAMNTVQTTGMSGGSENGNHLFVVFTHDAHCRIDGLWQACHESRRELLRLCVRLPARLVTDVGVNFIINQGQHMLRSTYKGERQYHREATFFMGELAAVEMFNVLCVYPPAFGHFRWLRNIMLDRRTFLHIMSGHHSLASRRGRAPFTELPSLRRIVVGFVYRFHEVAVAEGRYDDVVTEVQVTRRATDGEEEEWDLASGQNEIHPMIGVMILDTVRQTTKEVNDMKEAGIKVVWGVINTGLTRRPDAFVGFPDP
ncbi:hypothetical protein F5Y19DRAFT_350380 [Xylariaceae sp. FL1651]|nr:hypothetical protein F5Y19DRAFT_350380 [Xylariaceae sp. FL1651]